MRYLLVFALIAACSAFGQPALHEFKFDDEEAVAFVESKVYAIYPLSERAASVVTAGTERRVRAASYITDIRIKTTDPSRAAKAIMDQLAKSTQNKIGTVWDSRLQTAGTATILTGIAKHSTWTILIVPREGEYYVATISYVIDEESGG